MTLEDAERIAKFLEDAEGFEVEVRDDYSGRGMGGKTTPALVLNREGVVWVGWAAGKISAESEASGGERLDPPTRVDSMGYDVVVY